MCKVSRSGFIEAVEQHSMTLTRLRSKSESSQGRAQQLMAAASVPLLHPLHLSLLNPTSHLSQLFPAHRMYSKQGDCLPP